MSLGKVLGLGALGAGAGAALKNLGSSALEGALQGAIGGTLTTALKAGVSGARAAAAGSAPSGDAGTDQIRAMRDLQSDFVDQKEILKNIEYDMAATRETLGNIGVILVKSNLTLNKILDKLPGSFEKAIDTAVTGALAGAGLAAGAGAAARGIGTAAAATAGAAATASKTLAKRAPGIGGVLAGGLEYAESGNLARSLFVGAGAGLGAAAGIVAGAPLGPVGSAAGAVGLGAAGEYGGGWLYDRLFGSDSEKMAELAKKEEEKEKEKKEGEAAIKDTINFSSKEIVFKADDIKFEMVGASAAAMQTSQTGAAPGNAPTTPGPTGSAPSGAPGGAPSAAPGGAPAATPSGAGAAPAAMANLSGSADIAGGGAMMPDSTNAPTKVPEKVQREPMADLSGGMDIAGGGAMAAGAVKEAMTPSNVAQFQNMGKSSEFANQKLGPQGGTRVRKPVVAAAAPSGPSEDEVRKLWERYNETGSPADFVRADKAMMAMKAAQAAAPAGKVVAQGGRKAAPKKVDLGPASMYGESDAEYRARKAAQDAAAKEGAPGYEGVAGKVLDYNLKQVQDLEAERNRRAAEEESRDDAERIRAAGERAKLVQDQELEKGAAEGKSLAQMRQEGSGAGMTIRNALRGRDLTTLSERMADVAEGSKASPGAPMDAELVGGVPGFNAKDWNAAYRLQRATDAGSSSDMGFGAGGASLNQVRSGEQLMSASTIAEQQFRAAVEKSTTSPYTEGAVLPEQTSTPNATRPTNEVESPMLPKAVLQNLFGDGTSFGMGA
jgi:phage terminase Nu1 subunit (DNA packaging protein)